MLMILAQAHPREDRGRDRRPVARDPSAGVAELADDRVRRRVLGRDGRLGAAVRRVYAERLKTQPDLAETMRRLNRAREVELGLGLTT